MPGLASNPAFIAYSLTAAVLCLKLWVLWARTGGVRAKTKTTPNAEDIKTVNKDARLEAVDPEPVHRAMRVFNNSAANEVPFLILGLVYVLLGAQGSIVTLLFGVFVGARIVHAIVYSIGLQPWRTLSFAVGQLAAAGVVVQVVRIVIAAM